MEGGGGRRWKWLQLKRLGFLLKFLILATLFALGEGTCGNGVVEDQEECDCGSAAQCQDPCCRALVCTLKEGAECSNLMPCCKNCKFKRKWDLCRVAANECDLPEYCSGKNSNCPPNIFQKDGKNCSHGQGYCFKGYCRTHTEQCRVIFKGPQVTAATPECYRHLNQMGNEHGHCGGNVHRACRLEDALCGTLQCQNVEYVSGSSGGAQLFNEDDDDRVVIGENEHGHIHCPTFVATPLVQDRTKCGDSKICLNQQCVNISTVISPGTCPTSTSANGSLECSGRGDCTSRHSCLCHIGWGGRDCSQPEEIVEVKYVATTMATPRIHDIPVTRSESQGIITHKHPELEEYTTYTLGMIFAVVVVSVSIICFMVALVYCYFFSSPIAKAKESLDSQIDEYTLENNGPMAQSQQQHEQQTQPSKLSSSSPCKLGAKVIIISSTSPEMNGRISSPPPTTNTTIHCNDPAHSQMIKTQNENRIAAAANAVAVAAAGEKFKKNEDLDIVELPVDSVLSDSSVTVSGVGAAAAKGGKDSTS